MKNFIAAGNTLTITAEADIASGAGVLIGSIFGVATGPIANGAEGVINLTGVYDLPKTASQSFFAASRGRLTSALPSLTVKISYPSCFAPTIM